MRGIYVIECEGRVLYVGQSEKIQERVKYHFNIIQDEKKPQGKMYWILWQARKCGLHLKCWLVETVDKSHILKDKENENIRQLKPVLNTQMPKGMTPYINKLNSLAEALITANTNGYWNFTNLELLWEFEGEHQFFSQEENDKEMSILQQPIIEDNFYIYGIFMDNKLVYIGAVQGKVSNDIRTIEKNGYKGQTAQLYLALKKQSYDYKILWEGCDENVMYRIKEQLNEILMPKYK